MVEAGQCLGIHVLDHLILTTRGFFSIKEEGLLEPEDEQESPLQALLVVC